jgi:hypothetical protein
MLPAAHFHIRPAFADDEPAVNRLAYLAGRTPPARPALLGHVDSVPAAAIGIEDDAIVADPAHDAGLLRSSLRTRAAATRAYANRPDLRDRIRAALRRERLDAPRPLVRR